MAVKNSGFRFARSLFVFLEELAENNRRDWFQDNKQRYEEEVVGPVMDFIEAMQPRLHSISPHFSALTGKTGGSMMRIYRDVRFSKNKQPYKTNVGIQFRHALGRDVHAPGFYVHLEPDSCFLGAGIWSPASDALGCIRSHIDENPRAWIRARDSRTFNAVYDLSKEDSLKTAPKGYPKDHPLIQDLRRKHFIGARNLTDKEVSDKAFTKLSADSFRAAKPLMKFLCEALGVAF